MSKASPEQKPIRTLADLLAHALAMETEACDRYGELADQMATYNNPAVAKLFRRLEALEKEHVAELEGLCKGIELPQLAPWEYRWPGGESPEAIDISRVHYAISQRDAVLLALEHERLAADFYTEVADSAELAEVKGMAQRFADEEFEHVQWLEKWLAECGPEAARGIDDPDPPNSLE